MTAASPRVQAEIERLGIQVERQGQAFRLRGAGIDLTVASLAALNVSDLLTSGGGHQHKRRTARRKS